LVSFRIPSSVFAGATAFFQRAVFFFQEGLMRAFDAIGLAPVGWPSIKAQE